MNVFSHINLEANLHFLFISPSCTNYIIAISAMKSSTVASSKKSCHPWMTMPRFCSL